MTFEEFQEYIKNEYPQENCPVSKTLELLGGKWTSRVIYELEKADQLRFGQLKKKLDWNYKYNAVYYFENLRRTRNRREGTIQ